MVIHNLESHLPLIPGQTIESTDTDLQCHINVDFLPPEYVTRFFSPEPANFLKKDQQIIPWYIDGCKKQMFSNRCIKEHQPFLSYQLPGNRIILDQFSNAFPRFAHNIDDQFEALVFRCQLTFLENINHDQVHLIIRIDRHLLHPAADLFDEPGIIQSSKVINVQPPGNCLFTGIGKFRSLSFLSRGLGEVQVLGSYFSDANQIAQQICTSQPISFCQEIDTHILNTHNTYDIIDYDEGETNN